MMERELDDWLRRAASQQRAAAERALYDIDLTPAQFAVLSIVTEQPGASAAEVSRIERLTPPTLSVIVGNLIRKKALDKRPHPDNARIQQLEATELGMRLFHDGEARMKDSRRKLRAALPSGAEASVAVWLRAVASDSH